MPMSECFASSELPDARAFWQYSLKIYQPEAHARCLLWLQDNLRADVNVLLVLGYLYQLGLQISAEQWKYVLTYSKPLRDQVNAIRAQRREAKESSNPAQYERLKQVELAAEQRVQESLITAILATKHQLKKASDHAEIGVQHYLESLLPDAETSDDYQPCWADVINLLNPKR